MLGNVVSSGVKILVLAMIVGIGSTIFNQFTSGIGASPTINDALTLILAALTLLGMTIFGPGIANGLIAGGPQLGAGAAVGTSLAVGGLGYAGASLAGGGAGAIGGAALRAGRGVVGSAGGAATAIRSIGAAEVTEEGAATAASPLRGSSGATGSAAAQGWAGTRGARLFRLLASRIPPSRLRGFNACGAVRLSAAASPPPNPPFAPAIIPAQAAASISLRGISQCSDDRLCATDARPSLKRPTREPAQAWDERIGSARVQAKNWRLAFFGTLILTGGLSAGLVWQSARGTVTPWVVQVDKLGQAQAIAPAIADYRPTDPQIAWHLARFIEEVRRIPADPIVLRQNWLDAYNYVTDRGALALNDYARTSDPFSKVDKAQVSVEISSVIRASA